MQADGSQDDADKKERSRCFKVSGLRIEMAYIRPEFAWACGLGKIGQGFAAVRTATRAAFKEGSNYCTGEYVIASL